jgi:hypothetical protein
MESDTVSEFYKYSSYHELMKKNIIPVVLDILEKMNELACLAPDVIKRQVGHPVSK